MGRKSELKSLFVTSGGIFEKSIDNDEGQRRIAFKLPYVLNLIY